MDACQDKEDLLVGVTNNREAYPKFWIAALVQMNCEKKAELQLRKLGYETYLPIQKEEHYWSDRKKLIDRIVIPMIVFIHVSKNEDKIVRNYSFIHKLLTLPGSKEVATPIPDFQIENLRFLLSNAESKVTITSKLHVGDDVKIVKGALRGLVGQLCMINEGKSTVAIRIDILGYACVTISSKNVEKLQVGLTDYGKM